MEERVCEVWFLSLPISEAKEPPASDLADGGGPGAPLKAPSSEHSPQLVQTGISLGNLSFLLSQLEYYLIELGAQRGRRDGVNSKPSAKPHRVLAASWLLKSVISARTNHSLHGI